MADRVIKHENRSKLSTYVRFTHSLQCLKSQSLTECWSQVPRCSCRSHALRMQRYPLTARTTDPKNELPLLACYGVFPVCLEVGQLMVYDDVGSSLTEMWNRTRRRVQNSLRAVVVRIDAGLVFSRMRDSKSGVRVLGLKQKRGKESICTCPYWYGSDVSIGYRRLR